MGKRDPIIDEVDYVSEALDAMEMILPDELPGRRMCFVILAALWKRIDGQALRQSDLDALHEAFDAAADALKP